MFSIRMEACVDDTVAIYNNKLAGLKFRIQQSG